MAKKGRPTDADILAQLDDLGSPDTATAPGKSSAQLSTADIDSLERELGLPERAKPASRPHTPRGPAPTSTAATKSSPKPISTSRPPSNDGARSSEEKNQLRKSGESSRSFHTSFTPASTEGESPPEKMSESGIAPEVAPKASGGWWGALSATASAAVKQAEALAKEIQHNEEAQRWATQVKGNVGALRGLGTY